MKKSLLIIGLLTLTLGACNNPQNSSSDKSNTDADFSAVSIISPQGAPALAFYNLASKAQFETNSDPTNIVAMMAAGQKDVVVLPTNAGIQAIKGKNAPYKIAATITFGNFFMVSLGNDDNNQMDTSDKILLFQQNNIPDKLFHYVYGDSLNDSLYYVNAVSDATKAVKTGSFVDAYGNNVTPNYVLLAEPALTSVLDQVTVYANLQEEYKKKSNDLDFFQASVFIKNTLENKIAPSVILSTLENDVKNAIANPDLLAEGMNKVEAAQSVFGVAPQMATNVLKRNNGMGLGYKAAKANKAGIDKFLSLFNIAETDEEIYL